MTVYTRKKNDPKKWIPNSPEMPPQSEKLSGLYPDYKKEDTFVVTRILDTEERRFTWDERRTEVQERYGRILEDVVSESEATFLGKAYFRVAKPVWMT